MSSGRKDLLSGFKKQATIGDGNCAFNAFALGLCQREVLEYVRDYYNDLSAQKDDGTLQDKTSLELIEDFFESIIRNAGTSVKSYDDLIHGLIKARESNDKKSLEMLQKAVAPGLRALAVGLARKDTAYPQETLQAFLAAYDDYINLNPAAGPSDDIFTKHQCVRDFFEKVKKEKLNEQAVQDWWLGQGHKDFIDEMAKTGEWAGDLELKQLGRFFGINVDVISDQAKKINGKYVQDEHGKIVRTQALHHVSLNHGELPDDSENLWDDDVEELRARGVIGLRQGAGYPILLDLETLERRLNPVPNYDVVEAFLKNDKSSVVPKDWPQACIDELVVRGVIRKLSGSADYLVNQALSSKAAALARIAAYANQELSVELLGMAELYEMRPTVTLYNKDAAHYEFALPEANLDSELSSSYGDDIYDVHEEVIDLGPSPSFSASASKGVKSEAEPPKIEILEPDLSSSPSPVVGSSSLSSQPKNPNGTLFAPAPCKMTSPTAIKAIEAELKTAQPTWTVAEVKPLNQPSYYSVTDQSKAEKFQVHESKMTTQDADEKTFEVMLKCFRAANPTALPKVTTEDQNTKNAWLKACQTVYADKPLLDWDRQITLRASVQNTAPPPAPAPKS